MTDPITPPPELRRQWLDNDHFPMVTGTHELLSITIDLVTRARALLAQLVAEGPTDEEVTLTYAYAVAAAVGNKRGPFKPEDAEAAQLAGLRAVLARWGRPTPQPVAVSERLPGPGDCDEQGRCWIFMPDIATDPSWRLANPRDIGPYHTHWAPANALPTPEAINVER